MKKSCLFALSFLLLPSLPCVAQDLSLRIEQLKSSYAASGSVVVLDEKTLLIEPNMPGPICALPLEEGGKTTWSILTFPLASITVPLAAVDESLIGENLVFTGPDVQDTYKPGDVGDTTMVVVVGLPGKQFQTLTYDRDKLTHLGPGPHAASAYGQAPDKVEAFGLTFPDHAAAHAFETALKDAVIMAKAETAHL
jgi:hypothetical protein